MMPVLHQSEIYIRWFVQLPQAYQKIFNNSSTTTDGMKNGGTGLIAFQWVEVIYR